MKKLIIAMLTMVPLAATATNFGLTVDTISANINGGGKYSVAFMEGNPIPGPTGCTNRYNFDEHDVAIVGLIRDSRGGEKMTFTLVDEFPTIRNNCDIVGIETIN